MYRAKNRSRTWGPLATVAAALTLAVSAVTPALASTVSPVNTTYDGPSITDAPGGGYYIAWAGTDANGKVNGAMVNSAGTINSDAKWTDTSSSTYPGTGTAIGFDYSLDVPLVAWTDLGGTVHVALDLNSSSGLICD